VPGDLDAGPAEEAAPVADLEQVGERVEPDQDNGDQREPRERNVVFDGEDLARLAVIRAEGGGDVVAGAVFVAPDALSPGALR
jgi:hypothetical protein